MVPRLRALTRLGPAFVVAIALLAPTGLLACTGTDVTSPSTSGPSGAGDQPSRTPLPVGESFDYQLTEAYPPPAAAKIIVRDYRDDPVPGRYNICYINGLQTQPEELSWWTTNHPDLLLTDAGGAHVIDTEWDEVLFDVRTAEQRSALAEIEAGWLDACAQKGFQAVEVDNQDSFARSAGLLTFEQDKEFMRLLVPAAHARGLAIGQKNAGAEYGDSGRTELGLDFAVVEECSHWAECDYYTGPFGRAVLQIEYTDQPAAAFDKACQDARGQHPVIRRDRQLQPAGHRDHHYETCGS